MQSDNDSFSQDPFQEPIEEPEQPKNQKKFIQWESKTKLRACLRCKLIKNEVQWVKDQKCENCGPFKGGQQYKKYTSNRYENVACLIEPSKSWLRRKMRLGKHFVAGMYAGQVL